MFDRNRYNVTPNGVYTISESFFYEDFAPKEL